MWHLSKIPKIIHFYWGNEKMSYLRYMAMESFKRFNPEWKICVHMPKFLSNAKPTWNSDEQKYSNVQVDYFEALKNLGVEIFEHDFETLGFTNDVHEVYKADYIRWILLSKIGGVWSDADILYTKSIDNLRDNVEANKDLDIGLCTYGWGDHAIGFLMSSPDNQFFSDLALLAREQFHFNDYQAIGSSIFNRYYRTIGMVNAKYPNHKCIFIDPLSVYSIDCTGIEYFYKMDIDINHYTEGAIGFHWYAGHPLSQQYENWVNETNFHEIKNTIGRIINVAKG